MSLRRTPQTLDKNAAASRRPVIPTGRAVVGGLLVAVAAVGTFSAYAGTSGDQGRNYVVVALDLPAGHRIEASDLRVEHGDLTATLAERGFRSADQLEGAVTLAPLTSGELVQHGQVALSDDATPAPTEEFSFAVDRDRALNGTIRRGEAIDVLATFGTGTDAYTLVVARHASVTDVSELGSNTIGSGSRLILTLALETSDEVLALAHASQVASITIVRTTGVERDATAPQRYPISPKASTQVADR